MRKLFNNEKFRFIICSVLALLLGPLAILPLAESIMASKSKLVFCVGVKQVLSLVAVTFFFWGLTEVISHCASCVTSNFVVLIEHFAISISSIFSFVITFLAIIKLLFSSAIIGWSFSVSEPVESLVMTIYLALLSFTISLSTATKWAKS